MWCHWKELSFSGFQRRKPRSTPIRTINRPTAAKGIGCFHLAEVAVVTPTCDVSFLEAERARDAEYFEREYAAIFSDSITNAFSREAVEACVIQGRYELPYRRGLPYCAGVDPSGGGRDEFALSICHREADKVVQDVVEREASCQVNRERTPPRSPPAGQILRPDDHRAPR